MEAIEASLGRFPGLFYETKRCVRKCYTLSYEKRLFYIFQTDKIWHNSC